MTRIVHLNFAHRARLGPWRGPPAPVGAHGLLASEEAVGFRLEQEISASNSGSKHTAAHLAVSYCN